MKTLQTNRSEKNRNSKAYGQICLFLNDNNIDGMNFKINGDGPSGI